ncbi:hypothetical protein CPLU01_05464 [Colletotrichum plurivorum]|uniref:Uncharacterized protein n=1 Tax=Colletotrichum plurivorum TaxID=2175906 RepID=A0A8H6KMC1_9PEZI|nr:hypothetical protein CPLU01_05464 [Colletotrichum plurivorum]
MLFTCWYLPRPRQLPKGWGPSARRDLQTNLGLIRHHPWRLTPTTPRTDGPSRHLAAAAAYSVPFPNALGYGPQTNKGALITVAIAKGTKPRWRSCSFDSLADADGGVFDKKWRLRPLEATPSAGLQIATRLGRLRFTAGNTLREQRDGLAPSRIRTGPTTLAIFRGPKQESTQRRPIALWSLANSFTNNGTTLPNGEGSRDGTVRYGGRGVHGVAAEQFLVVMLELRLFPRLLEIPACRDGGNAIPIGRQ